MKLLSDSRADDTNFFVEQVYLVAIVFDNTDDVTVWATSVLSQDEYFFHLALPFHSLDTLLRLAHDRTDALQEEVADALAAGSWPALLEYNTEDKPPISLPNVALKLSVTYPADEDESDDPQPHNIFYLEGVYVRLDS